MKLQTMNSNCLDFNNNKTYMTFILVLHETGNNKTIKLK